VLREPEPLCWMTGFGDSSQDFELRAFVAEIGQRNPVRTELQMRIAEVFRQHDIEIAFPQMDLWMRNGLAVQETPGRADGGVGTETQTTQQK
jgi:potassium efflux system protein